MFSYFTRDFFLVSNLVYRFLWQSTDERSSADQSTRKIGESPIIIKIFSLIFFYETQWSFSNIWLHLINYINGRCIWIKFFFKISVIVEIVYRRKKKEFTIINWWIDLFFFLHYTEKKKLIIIYFFVREYVNEFEFFFLNDINIHKLIN